MTRIDFPSVKNPPLSTPTPNTTQILHPPSSTMGITLSTAQVLAPLSFAVDFGAQLYGMLSNPNMKQIHDRNMAAFSPYANMIGYFFLPQQLLQLWWLRRLWTNPEPDQVKYVPYYALGNFCIAGWMLFWVPPSHQQC
jgi:hypothetical protein